jgi:hypothetical protein
VRPLRAGLAVVVVVACLGRACPGLVLGRACRGVVSVVPENGSEVFLFPVV